jgi:hypothetical protein
MADRDKDGIEDNIDIDGGNGTNKPVSTTPLADAQKVPTDVAAIINAVMATSGGSANAKSGSDTSTSKVKLTSNSARAIMELAAKDAGYPAKFSSADVEQFMKEFDAEQARQIETVITSSSSKITPGGTTPGAVDKTISSTAKTEFPSFFNVGSFTKDWVWKRISFKDETTQDRIPCDA